MNINNSPDISLLQVQVTWDISNPLPQINLLNQSQGNNLAGCSWAFVATSPSQTPIHAGDINQPDIIGAWSSYILNDSFPRPFNQIEWSGAPYSFYVVVKDSNGNVYTNDVQQVSICQPFGNTDNSKNTYGIASSDVKVKCQDAHIFFQDTTYHTYKGSDGSQISSVLRVIYPIDETLVIPPPFVHSPYSSALVHISSSSENYQFVQSCVYDYNLGQNSLVRVKYQTIRTFPVYCNVDLLPLVCEMNKLIDAVEDGSCVNISEAQRKMNLVVAKFALVMIGIEQPLTGVDVPTMIDEIIEIGGFEGCNCCSASSGIIPTTSSVISGYNFLVNKLGGDVNASWSANGNNITLNISDVSYVIAIGSVSPSVANAFSVSSIVSGGGYLKTYYINIDGYVLATQMLLTIKNDSYLSNLFNSIVVGSGTFALTVDGKCVFNSGACDFIYTLSNIPASTTFANLDSIQVNGVYGFFPFAFNQTNLGALQVYLNTLGLGTFTVANIGGNQVTITTNTNTSGLGDLIYIVGTKQIATLNKNCTGFTHKDANQVVQAIIDYLCGITDNDMVTSQPYVICYIDPTSGLKTMTTVPAGTKENLLISQILDKDCSTIDYIMGLSALNCAGVIKMFQPNINVLQSNDIILGTKQGQCSGINPVELLTRMLQLIVYNSNGMKALCDAVSLCAGGLSCEPYTVFQISTSMVSPLSNLIDILVTFTHPSAISNTIRYARIDNTNTPVYTTITGILAGASPYTIPNLDAGQYYVGITPIYADGRSCSEVSLVTPACGAINSFSAALVTGDIVVTYSATSPKVKVFVNYPNGGVFTQVYNNGDSISIVPPSGLIGDIFVTIAPVCNETTGWIGAQTPPSVLVINASNNSSITNNSGVNISTVTVTTVDIFGSVLVFSATSLSGAGGTGAFYVPDGFYTSINIGYLGTTLAGALVTGSGAYSMVSDKFNNVTASGGVTITLVLSSPSP